MSIKEIRRMFIETLKAQNLKPKRFANTSRRILKSPKKAEMSYANALWKLMSVYINEVIEGIKPEIDRWVREANYTKDSVADDLPKLAVTFLGLLDKYQNDFELIASRNYEKVFNINQNQWNKLMVTLYGKEIFLNTSFKNEMKKIFIQNNVALIKKASQDTLRNIERVVYSGINSNLRPEEIRADIKGGVGSEFNAYKSRIKLIARDQMSKAYGDINEQNQRSVGVSDYIWDTVDDADVRNSHRVLEGKVCKWSDPSVYKNNLSEAKWKQRSSINGYIGHPSRDYQCRCVAIPVMPI